MADAVSEVRKVIEDWVAAVKRRDLEAVLHRHATDIVMYDVPPPFQSRGIKAYRNAWDGFFAGLREPTAFDIREMEVVAGEDVAFVYAAMRCAGREAVGDDIDLDFRLTIGLRRIVGQWTIVHEHHSVPVEA